MERIIKFDNLKKLAKDNNYKHICLISPEGVKMVNFNSIDGKTTFDQNLVKIQKKLNSPVYSSGKYKILLSEKLTRGYHPDEFYIYKSAEMSEHTDNNSHNNQPVIIHQQAPVERALSFEKAIELNGELANLKAERLYLLEQIKNLQDEVSDLEAELETKNQLPLEEAPANSFITTLKEYAPSILAYLDKSLLLKEKELNKQTEIKPSIQKKPIITGSNAHLQLLDFLFKRNQMDQFYKELDKLSNFNLELYELILEKYNLNQSEENESYNESGINES